MSKDTKIFWRAVVVFGSAMCGVVISQGMKNGFSLRMISLVAIVSAGGTAVAAGATRVSRRSRRFQESAFSMRTRPSGTLALARGWVGEASGNW